MVALVGDMYELVFLRRPCSGLLALKCIGDRVFPSGLDGGSREREGELVWVEPIAVQNDCFDGDESVDTVQLVGIGARFGGL